MVEMKSHNLKVFSFILKALELFGVSKFKNKESWKLEIFIRIYSGLLILAFSWYFCTSYVTALYDAYYDSTTNYARLLDRSALIFLSIGILSDATFRCKRNHKLIELFDDIDETILTKFGVKLSYRKIKLLFGGLIVFHFFPFIVMIQMVLITKLSMSNARTLLPFLVMQFIVINVRIFHFLLVVQFFIRCKIIEKIVNENSETLIVKQQFVFIKLFHKIGFLMDIFNDNFGFIVLMNVGKTIK